MSTLGLKPKEAVGLESYRKGQWLKIVLEGHSFYGLFDKTHDGDLILSRITEVASTRKGYELCIINKETVLSVGRITMYRRSSREEVNNTIAAYSPYQEYFGEYVVLRSGDGISYCGKIAKLWSDAIDLLPSLGFKCEMPYIEEQRPTTIKTGNVQIILPSSREDLEHRLAEFKKQTGCAKTGKKKSSNSAKK